MGTKGTSVKTELAVDEKPVIYCLEGIWRDDSKDGRSCDWSVEPMLRLLEVAEYWDYRHRDVATKAEFDYYLTNEWSRCHTGSILYLATHGGPGAIFLNSVDCEEISFDHIAKTLGETGCDQCHVHFGGCSVLKRSMKNAAKFRDDICAHGVSGYRAINDWTVPEKPAILADLMLFSALSSYPTGGEDIVGNRREHRSCLRGIQTQMDDRFQDCEFRYV